MRQEIGMHGPIKIKLLFGAITLSYSNLRNGQPTTVLAKKLQDNYSPAAHAEASASLDRVRELIDARNPVMCLCQVGTETLSFKILFRKVKITIPLLHWYVAVDHGPSVIRVHDTNNDNIRDFPVADFERMRSWNNGGYNGKVGDAIRLDGARPGDIIYF